MIDLIKERRDIRTQIQLALWLFSVAVNSLCWLRPDRNQYKNPRKSSS